MHLVVLIEISFYFRTGGTNSEHRALKSSI